MCLTLAKIQREGVRGIVVVPYLLDSPYISRLKRMADAVAILRPERGKVLVAEARPGTEECPLLFAEIGLKGVNRRAMAAEKASRAWAEAME